MLIKKNKFIFLFLVFLILSLVMPFYIYASNSTAYVWSEISSPIVSTASILSEGER